MNVDELSKLLLGNSHRLSVAAAIADWSSPVVTCREIARDLRLADSVVRPELLRFEKAGILEALPRSGQSQQYERQEHPYWDLCRSLRDGTWRQTADGGTAEGEGVDDRLRSR